MNRFEILSSDDELVVPTTVPASSGAVREVVEGSAVQPRRLVIVSQDLPPILRAASTEELPGTTVLEASTEAHQIGTSRDNFSEDTVSVGRASEEDVGEVVEDDDLDDGRSDVGSIASEDEEAETPQEPDPEVREVAITPAVRAALTWLDQVDLVEVFKPRASVMKSVPKFLTGAFRIALRTALQEAVLGGDVGDEVRQIRGWKLLLLLPRLLLSKPPRGGSIGRDKLVKRFQMFADGQWQELLQFGVQCAGDLVNSRRRQRRRDTCSEAKRGERAFMLAQLGELSSARQALEGAELAPGNQETLEVLRRRPAQFRDPLPDRIVHHAPASGFELDEARFGRNLRTARKGAASGPSGMTSEHLRPLLSSPPAFHWFFRLGEHLVTARVPNPVIDAVRMGRMTALRKPAGGVRGIVVGDVIRRLVALVL